MDDVEQLLDQIARGEPSAVTHAAALTSRADEAVEGVVALTRSDDPITRAIALRALVALQGAQATPVLIEALGDPQAYVRSTVAIALGPIRGPGLGHALLARYERSEYPAARSSIAILAGDLEDPEILPRLRELREKEQDATAQRGCVLALARLGDHEAREEIAAALIASRHGERRMLLDLLRRMPAPWLLPPLALVLDDTTPLVYVGAHATEPAVAYLRAVDLAVNLVGAIARALGELPPIEPRDVTNYSPDEVEAVRRWLRPHLATEAQESIA